MASREQVGLVIMSTAINQGQTEFVVISRVEAGIAHNANLVYVVNCLTVGNNANTSQGISANVKLIYASLTFQGSVEVCGSLISTAICDFGQTGQ